MQLAVHLGPVKTDPQREIRRPVDCCLVSDRSLTGCGPLGSGQDRSAERDKVAVHLAPVKTYLPREM